MAVRKKTSAIKNPPKHLLGIQNLSVQEAKQISLGKQYSSEQIGKYLITRTF